MKHITPLMIASFVLYCYSDNFATALSDKRRNLIVEHIKKKQRDQEDLVLTQRPTGTTWDIRTQASAIVKEESEEECNRLACKYLKAELQDVKFREKSAVICDLRPKTGRTTFFTRKTVFNERHYTLFMEAPDRWTNTWTLHVVHDGKNRGFHDIFLTVLRASLNGRNISPTAEAMKKEQQDQLNSKRVQVKFEVSHYKEYPFDFDDLLANTDCKTPNVLKIDVVGAYISWVASLTDELRKVDKKISPKDIRATIFKMEDKNWMDALDIHQLARSSVVEMPGGALVNIPAPTILTRC